MKRLLKATLIVGCGVLLPVTAVAQTPIFDAIEADVTERSDPAKVQQCLLSARTLDYAAKNTKLLSEDSKRATRAAASMEKLEVSLKDRYQTDVLFNRAIGEVKAEYDQFKTAEKKTQKRLYGLAKGINKECWKRVDIFKMHRMDRYERIAKEIPMMASDKAELCEAAVFNNMTTRQEILDGLGKILVWNDMYIRAKRAEGFPNDQIVDVAEDGAHEAAMERLKALGPDTALNLHKDCEKKYEEAAFKARINEPTEDTYEFTTAVNWD